MEKGFTINKASVKFSRKQKRADVCSWKTLSTEIIQFSKKTTIGSVNTQ